LHKRFDELLSDLSLDLSSRIVHSKVVNTFLPDSVCVDLVKHIEGTLELFSENFTQFVL
jgi:hypothetical protein